MRVDAFLAARVMPRDRSRSCAGAMHARRVRRSVDCAKKWRCFLRFFRIEDSTRSRKDAAGRRGGQPSGELQSLSSIVALVKTAPQKAPLSSNHLRAPDAGVDH